MANLAMTAQEYARLKKAERAYFLEAIERSARLIFSRDVAIAARDEYRQALDMRLISEGTYFAQKFFQAFFSLSTLFFVLGTSIFLPYVIMWDIPSPPRDTRIVLWFILILALRSLYICIRIGAGHVVGDYGKFRAYMLKNRQEVQANWEEKCRTINRLNAQIEDEEQCIIPAAYRHAAGELLYIVKSGQASDMEGAIREYRHAVEMRILLQKLEEIQRQNAEIKEQLWEMQRDQAMLEGLMELHFIYHHR